MVLLLLGHDVVAEILVRGIEIGIPNIFVRHYAELTLLDLALRPQRPQRIILKDALLLRDHSQLRVGNELWLC